MNQLFKYGENEVRTAMIEGEPWFVAKDVCEILAHSDVSMATKRLDDDEKLTQTMFVSGQNRNVTVVNESGLYSLIMTSRKPEARAFKRWVTAEVLPTIRKAGMYATDALLDDPDLLLKTVTRLRDERAARLEAEKQLAEQAPKVAAYDSLMWAEGTVSMNQAAKSLGYGRNTLMAELRERKVLTQENVPYQRFVNRGYFTVVETTRAGKVYAVTRVTPQGIDFMFRELADDTPTGIGVF